MVALKEKVSMSISWRYNMLYAKATGLQPKGRFKILGKIHIHKGKNAIFSTGENFLFLSGSTYNPLTTNAHGCIFIMDLKSATPFPKCYLQEKWTFDS